MFEPRIVTVPDSKMVVTEWKPDIFQLLDFEQAWVSPENNKGKYLPKDFLSYDPQTDRFRWSYIVSDDCSDAKGYEFIDFIGGLYVTAVCIDENLDSLFQVIDDLSKWIKNTENFELDFQENRHRMTQVITSDEVSRALGYKQLEIYLPIKIK